MIKILATIVMLLSFSIFYLSQKHNIESLDLLKPYKEDVCKEFGGVLNFKLGDDATISCLSDEFAIELGDAKDWDLLVGKALYASIQTLKKPAIAVVMSNERDVAKLKNVALTYGIKVIELKQK